MKCWKCKGKGVEEYQFGDLTNPFTWKIIHKTCPVCGGKGKVK